MSEEDDSHSDHVGLDGGASPPHVVGISPGTGVAFTVAAVMLCPCNLRASEYLSWAF